MHKILLAATSDYFRAMLLGPMKESKEAKVDLKGITSAALDHIIDFIYTGEMSVDLDNLIEILNAGSHLQVGTALDLCSDYMISLLTFSNADELLSIADTYSLHRVIEHYNDKVLQHFEEYAATEQFLKLPATQLARYLAADALRVRSESMLYDAVARWYAHDQARRSDAVDQLLQQVRFCLLSEQQLVSLSQHWWTRQRAANMKYITVGLEYHRAAAAGYALTAVPTTGAQAKVRAIAPSLVLVHQGTAFRPFEVSSFEAADEKFYQLASDISGSRDCRIAHIDNFVYLCRIVDCGGGTLMNSLLRFDPRHLTLHELSACRRLRIDATLVVCGHSLYVCGGATENFTPLDSVECYDTHTNTWVELQPMPAATHSHASVCPGGNIIYMSGGVSGQERQPTNTLLAYDTVLRSWSSLEPMHCARRLHEMVVLGTDQKRIFVLGGIGGHSVHQQTQIPIEVYDTDTNQWSLLTSTLAGRSVGHFVAHNGRILSIGREHSSATEDEIWQYSIDSDTWSSYTKMPRRNGLATAAATLLAINFYDEKVYRRVISERR